MDHFGRRIIVPSSPAELPDLVTASQQLSVLSKVVNGLSDEVRSRASDEDLGLDLGPVIHAFTAGAVHAGQALGHFTEAYYQLGFLRRHAEARCSRNPHGARENAFRVIQDRLEQVHGSLHAGNHELRQAADQSDTTPPRLIATFSRSWPANSIYRPPSEPVTALVPRLPYTPVPRRAR